MKSLQAARKNETRLENGIFLLGGWILCHELFAHDGSKGAPRPKGDAARVKGTDARVSKAATASLEHRCHYSRVIPFLE